MYTKDNMTRGKMQSHTLARIYEEWGRTENLDTIKWRAARVAQCSSVWTGLICPCCGTLSHMHTYGCGDRLCPLCAARKARAVAAQAMQVVGHLNGRPLLLTLTIKNTSPEGLDSAVDGICEGWRRMYRQRSMRDRIIGWARTVEITFNEREGTYHPHLHAIVYVGSDDSLALRADTWGALWRDAMGLDYDPIIDVRPINDTVGAVYEVSKYVTKTSRILDLPVGVAYQVVRVLATVLYKRRLRAYGGQWSKVRRAFSMRDVDALDDGQIDTLSAQMDKDECCGSSMMPVTLMWAGMDYQISYAGGNRHEAG